jgi:hypothetical protein
VEKKLLRKLGKFLGGIDLGFGRGKNMKAFTYSFIIITTLLSLDACCKRLEKSQAEIIAGKKFLEYCEQEKLLPSLFSAPQFQEEKNNLWMVSYTKTDKPKQIVTILVDCNGHSETHRIID